jgi:hypothetical protein
MDDVWICPACGASYPPAAAPPDRCFLCEDERQWVPASGQRWTTPAQLAADGYATETRELEPDLIGIGVNESLGVGHRGLLVRTPGGNLLWDPPPFVDESALDAVRAAGGVAALASSHPHMYGTIVQWSHAFDAPMLLPRADEGWLARPDPAGIQPWTASVEPLPGVTVVQCGGHFPGSAVLHWAAGADGAGALFTGDTIMVTPGLDRLTFVWSAPNRLPLSEPKVRGIVEALDSYPFERVYSGWWSLVLDGGAKQTLARSAARYVELLRGDER